MKGFTFGLTRRVEEHWIDVSKSHQELKEQFPNAKDDSPDGLYTSVIVPEYLKGRKVLIIPIDEDNMIYSLEELMQGVR